MFKSSFKKSFYLSFLLGLSLLLGACSSSNEDTPPPNPFVVTSVTPSDSNLAGVSADITINFNKEFNPGSILNTQADLSLFIASQGFSIEKSIIDSEGKSTYIQVMGSINIDHFKTGLYRLTQTLNSGETTVLSILDIKALIQTDGSVAYQLIDANSNTILTITQTDIPELFDPSKQTIVSIKNLSNSTKVLGSVNISPKALIFDVQGYLDWQTSYEVTVKSSIITDSETPETLAEDKVWIFTTRNKPDPAVTGFGPTGLSNPLTNIYMDMNFDVDASQNLNSKVSVTKITNAGSSPVFGNVSYDSATRRLKFIASAGHLDYASQFTVVLSSTLSGNMGNINETLGNDFSWTFTTQAPQVLSFSPSAASAIIPKDDTRITIKFNYTINPASVNSSTLQVVNTTNGGSPVFHSTEVIGDTIILTPNTKLEYGQRYRVVATTGIYGSLDSNIRMISQLDWIFETEKRKVIQFYPAAGIDNFGINDTIYLDFNFPVSVQSIRNGAIRINFDNNNILGTISPYDISYNSSTWRASYKMPAGFDYNTYITVTVSPYLQDENGVYIHEGLSYTFKTSDKFMAVYNYTPTGTGVDVSNTIYADFVTNISSLSLNYVDDIIVTDCTGNDISGTIEAQGNRLYFDPIYTLESWCSYNVNVSQYITGTFNETRTSDFVWNFTTGGLKIEGVTLNAHSSDVTIDSDIILDFNMTPYIVGPYYLDADDYLSPQGIYLIDEFDETIVPIQLSVDTFYNEITIVPRDLLYYDSTYRIEVDFDAIRGNDFYESLEFDFTYTFATESSNITLSASSRSGALSKPSVGKRERSNKLSSKRSSISTPQKATLK